MQTSSQEIGGEREGGRQRGALAGCTSIKPNTELFFDCRSWCHQQFAQVQCIKCGCQACEWCWGVALALPPPPPCPPPHKPPPFPRKPPPPAPTLSPKPQLPPLAPQPPLSPPAPLRPDGCTSKRKNTEQYRDCRSWCHQQHAVAQCIHCGCRACYWCAGLRLRLPPSPPFSPFPSPPPPWGTPPPPTPPPIPRPPSLSLQPSWLMPLFLLPLPLAPQPPWPLLPSLVPPPQASIPLCPALIMPAMYVSTRIYHDIAADHQLQHGGIKTQQNTTIDTLLLLGCFLATCCLALRKILHSWGVGRQNNTHTTSNHTSSYQGVSRADTLDGAGSKTGEVSLCLWD
mmetsp:Transcript_33332/g.55119  ORF Transcript_33332/g.55119 Transcript_33332/m.55119 type:complete len:342 (-) Transcript_33332:77-1102(-)